MNANEYENDSFVKFCCCSIEFLTEEANKWLTAHNYKTITIKQTKENIDKYNPDVSEPYRFIFSAINKTLYQRKELYNDDIKKWMDFYQSYIPKEPIEKESETSLLESRLSTSSNVLSHPNDYGVTNKEWIQKTKN